MKYTIIFHNTQIGPMTLDQVVVYDVNENTMVSKDRGPFKPLYTYPELMGALQRKRAAYHNQGHQNVSDEISSKKLLCGIMAILFGTLGIQYFILGKVAGGFITILLSIITCGAWGILTIIQGILMLAMSDREFYHKYMATTSTFPLF